jgi:fatty acyl-CoA reductase
MVMRKFERKQISVVGNFKEANIEIPPELAKEITVEVDIIVNSAANTTFDERFMKLN